MASIAPPTFPSPSTRTDPTPHRLNFSNSIFSSSSRLKRASSTSLDSYHHSLSRVSRSGSLLCRCNNSGISDSPYDGDDSLVRGWDSAIQDVFRKTMKRFDDYVNSFWNQDKRAGSEVKGGLDYEGVELQDWDWEQWRKHFSDVDEQERIVSVLKSQLASAINREDYEDAARLKVAIAAATTNDTIAKAMSHLNRAVLEERYGDAALLRDYAGAGLVGWWAGISEDTHDPYGCIIHISAEHGRYVARSYSPRQLATAKDGAPLFEIFFISKKGEYKQQAVYLKRRKAPLDFPIPSFKTSAGTSNFDSLGSTEERSGLLEENAEDSTDSDERDEDSSLENTLRDLIPGVKVKVLKVTAPGKVDKDIISRVVEQIIEEEDEEQDIELESTDADDEVKDENDEEEDDIVLDADNGIPYGEEQSQIAVKVVVGGLVSKFAPGSQPKDLLRVPARLEKHGRFSFTFTVDEEDDNKRIAGGDGKTSPNKKAKLQGLRNVDHVMLDLAKFIGKGRIPMKVLKDVGELINLTLNQARNHQPLSGSTTFSRIDIPGNQDPLNGLYIGAHGLYTSEVIHLRRKFGQWKEDGRKKEPPNVEFYEYVEAVKLTGDPYVPAGQIAFRAKVGKTYQLPHKGIIPEEFGVVARYRGQGRLAEPGFRNPRWVDGELVILDGKYIKGGPVVGFVYWAPEFHFLVFFNRLRLHR